MLTTFSPRWPNPASTSKRKSSRSPQKKRPALYEPAFFCLGASTSRLHRRSRWLADTHWRIRDVLLLGNLGNHPWWGRCLSLFREIGNLVSTFLLHRDPLARGRSQCERGDSNPHGLLHWILSPARLPIPPLPRAPVKDSARLCCIKRRSPCSELQRLRHPRYFSPLAADSQIHDACRMRRVAQLEYT
jgi:hypothetical protein